MIYTFFLLFSFRRILPLGIEHKYINKMKKKKEVSARNNCFRLMNKISDCNSVCAFVTKLKSFFCLFRKSNNSTRNWRFWAFSPLISYQLSCVHIRKNLGKSEEKFFFQNFTLSFTLRKMRGKISSMFGIFLGISLDFPWNFPGFSLEFPWIFLNVKMWGVILGIDTKTQLSYFFFVYLNTVFIVYFEHKFSSNVKAKNFSR